MDNKILVIAGMHRSGTSLISQWLYQCGLNLGDKLLGAGIGNAEGHFEDVDFLKFHEEILMDHQLPSNGYIVNELEPLSAYQKQKLKGIIGFKSKLSNQWGWKEPRTCLFLDFYQELIPGAYYLMIIRDHQSTISSMLQRDFKGIETKYLGRGWLSRQVWTFFRRNRRKEKFYHLQSALYLQVWITYNECLLKCMQMLPASKYVVTDYSLLHQLDTKVFNHLANKWNFILDYTAFGKVYKEKLISDVVDIAKYINDKKLIDKARHLEKEIRSYI
jgi:hypothetical protein